MWAFFFVFPSLLFSIKEDRINYFNVHDYNDKNKLIDEVNKIPLYEELLYEIYLMMRRNNVLGIEWINKKF